MATQNQTILELNDKLTAAQARIEEIEERYRVLDETYGHTVGDLNEAQTRLAEVEKERDEARDYAVRLRQTGGTQ